MIDEIKNFQELNLKKYPTIIKVNIGYDIWNYIFYSSLILIHVVFIILDRKSSKKDNSNGPKFIANK